jgi:hypothetical protein
MGDILTTAMGLLAVVLSWLSAALTKASQNEIFLVFIAVIYLGYRLRRIEARIAETNDHLKQVNWHLATQLPELPDPD